MRLQQTLTSVLASVVLAGFTTVGLAQDEKPRPREQQQRQEQGERQRTEATTLTGCLAKGESADQYILTDKAGTKTTVRASSGVALDKHSANHTVKLTGSKDTDGTFTATGIEHISATCETK